ncbi:hypothetical protein [Haladaptatus cibarius]|uniref:hypothetical protein n=1 Tax=Haladaptatus cibarius TaxID=453847 RepID=UPI0006789B28|nr:hypothetical protein [Haladaptatus cibarius]
MQRRAAALYAAFFFLIVTGSYIMLATAAQPVAEVDNPDYSATSGDTFSVDNREYNISDISATVNEDGELVRSAEATWTNQSAMFSASLENNSTLQTNDNVTYRVLIPNESNPTTATLSEVQNLSEDTQTVKQNGVTYVVVNETSDNSSTNKSLVPVDEYKRQQFDQPDTQELREGNQFQYQNNSTTVQNITNQSMTLQWTGPKTNSVSLGETTAIKTTLVRGGTPEKFQFPAGGTAELNGKQYAVHYPDNSTLVLSSDVDGYQTQLDDVRHQTERFAGFWGIVILGMLAAILLLGMAFLPNKS